MHSQRVLDESAYWWGAGATITAGPNCWAIVRATKRRRTSPVTMPRTPPSSLAKAVNSVRPQQIRWQQGELGLWQGSLPI